MGRYTDYASPRKVTVRFFDSLAERPNCFIATRGPLVVLHWTDVASVDAVGELRAAFQRAAGDPDDILFVTYLEEKTLSRQTPQDFREALAKLLSEFGSEIGASVIVLEKAGFKGAMLRAIVSTINLLSGAQFPASVHGNLREAIEWLIEKTNASGHSPDGIVSAMEQLRTQPA